MKLLRVLPYSKQLLTETVEQGETVIDATAGNGNDTLFLAQLVGESGHVFAFDIQQEALDATSKRLGTLTEHTTLILDSHAHVKKYVTEPIGGAMFNLGYLPYSEDQSIVTKPDSTIQALQQILSILKVGGIITISVYDGHPGGAEERDALLDFVTSIHQADVHVIKYELINVRNNPPFLIAIEKLRDFDELTIVE